MVSLVLEGLLRPGPRGEHGLLASDLGTSVWVHCCILKEGELGAWFPSPFPYPGDPCWSSRLAQEPSWWCSQL